MNALELVLAVLLIFLIVKLIKNKRATREDASESTQRPQQTDACLEQLSQLEERIRVLERIITDDHADLKHRFRNL